ncbi:hypothetical protein BDQ17DRAFT_1329970 [Cyathus striatus]|nr:hypothetical protein BDQ17DRAFT_1329970 [Cyathus striatus]
MCMVFTSMFSGKKLVLASSLTLILSIHRHTRPCTHIESEAEKPSTIHPSGVRHNRAYVASRRNEELEGWSYRSKLPKHDSANDSNSDEAPETVSLSTYKQSARLHEEAVKKAQKAKEVNRNRDRKLKEQKEGSRDEDDFDMDSDEDSFGSVDEDDSGMGYSDVDSIIFADNDLDDDEEEEEEFTVDKAVVAGDGEGEAKGKKKKKKKKKRKTGASAKDVVLGAQRDIKIQGGRGRSAKPANVGVMRAMECEAHFVRGA